MKDLQVVFTETSKDEVNRTLNALGVLDVSKLAENSTELQHLLVALSEIFSTELPILTGELDQDLMRVSRDINLSRLFRNRGIMLFYRLLNEKIDNIPVYQYFNNPYTESPFRGRTEFIDWFSKDAHISRDIIFRNIAAIDRSMEVGLTLDKSYEYLNKYAHAFRETLKNVLQWDEDTRRKLIGIDPDIALNIAQRVDRNDPDRLDLIYDLVSESKNGNDDASKELIETMKPSIIKLLDEVTSQDTAKDAMQFVNHDILTKPEIKYRWNTELRCIEINLTRKSIADTGEEYTDSIVSVNLLIDSEDVPEEIVDDLIKRLPISNRIQVDI